MGSIIPETSSSPNTHLHLAHGTPTSTKQQATIRVALSRHAICGIGRRVAARVFSGSAVVAIVQGLFHGGTLVSFNGGLTATLPTARWAARGDSGGRLAVDLSSEDVRARSTFPTTGFPRGPAVHKSTIRPDPRVALRERIGRTGTPSVLVGVDSSHSTRINCIQPPSFHPQMPGFRIGCPVVSLSEQIWALGLSMSSSTAAWWHRTHKHTHTPAACQPSWSQFLIPCSLGNDSSRQISVFHPLPLFHWMREIGASRSGHICTPSHLTQPFHWVQHRCGLHNTDMSLAAKAHHGILPTCLGENLGQIGVDITSISLSSRYSARHTVTALYRRLLRTSVPALLPRHATGQRVHTAYAMYSIMFTDISKCLSKSRAAPDHLQRPEDVAGVGDIETREMASSSYTNTQNLGVILPCPVCQLRYRHLEDSIHMPLLGTEHTNLPCGVLIFNMHEDCSNKHTRPPQLSLVHHDSPTSGTPY